MMKKTLLFLLMCFCVSLCFAQGFDKIVESEVSDFDLAKMENNELRLFKNKISDKRLLERIKIFESRNEKAVPLKFGNEIIGLWHASPIMPDTWVDRFLIYPGNKMEFLVDYFVENPEVKEYLGRYQVRGNVLIFTVERLQKKDRLLSLKNPLVFKFPITNVFEEKFAGGNLVRQTIQIGSLKYYLYDDDPLTIGAKARQY